MCLIIASETGQMPSDSMIREAWQSNPDGFGIAWSQGGSIATVKTTRYSKVRAALNAASGHPYVMHFRFATHGTVDIENVHPFRVTRHLYMAHNGIINGTGAKARGRSDSWHYARHVSGMIASDPRAHNFDRHLPAVLADVGPFNKLAFLRADGRIFIVNREMGVELDGAWHSNSCALPLDLYDDDTDGLWSSYYDNPLADYGRAFSTLALAGGGDGAWGRYNDTESADGAWGELLECEGCDGELGADARDFTIDGTTIRLCRECVGIFLGSEVVA